MVRIRKVPVNDLFALLKDLEEKKGQRSEILHQQDMLIEKSRMRTTELDRLTLLLSQLDEEYAAKQAQLTDSERECGRSYRRKKGSRPYPFRAGRCDVCATVLP